MCAYILDSGVDDSHADFVGRAKRLRSFADNDQDHTPNEHGTHVAGTVGSTTWGVFKTINIYGVKTLQEKGDNPLLNIIAAIDWVAQDHKTRDGCKDGAVANMSFGGGRSASLNEAAANLQRSGAFVAVSSGNDADDAEGQSPASEQTICTVGASTIRDGRWFFSNYGRIGDIFAPGEDVVSAGLGGGSETFSGTSMSSPHIAGLGAYLIAIEGIKADAVCKRIRDMAQKRILSNVKRGTPNLLAYNGNPSG